jgi:hypothetical protein
VEVDDVTDEREDAVEMGKGHARQGSPVLSHGLAPAGGVSGDARDLAELALERCERGRSMLAVRSVQQSNQSAVRTFSTSSRPALRAAAAGGRPRPAP